MCGHQAAVVNLFFFWQECGFYSFMPNNRQILDPNNNNNNDNNKKKKKNENDRLMISQEWN